MHVEVTKLRRQGVKIPERERDAPEVGFIRISYWHLKNEQEDRLIRSVALRPVDNDVSAKKADMDDCHLKELRGEWMLFVGIEYDHRNRQRHKQAWLVRLLTNEERSAIRQATLTQR